jgi:hypothetical protein
MAYCININNFDIKNLNIGKTQEYNGIKLNKLYYKYDYNVSSELKILTNSINIVDTKKYYKNDNYIIPNSLILIIDSVELKNLLNNIKNYINLNSTNSTNLNKNDENDSDYNYDSDNDNDSDNNLNLTNNLNNQNNDNNLVRLYFKNSKSELKLHPTKKSGLELYTLKDIKNYSKIDEYYPYIKKYSIIGNFILYLQIINNIPFLYIQSGDLQNSYSFIKKNTNITNIYDTKIVIDI